MPHREIVPRAVEDYLRRRGHPDARVVEMTPLGREDSGHLKSYGYGKPLRVTFVSKGQETRIVLRTQGPDPFGHDRRADRFASMILSLDTFDRVPRHVRALDAGAFDDEGGLVSVPRGEPFLITTYVEGDVYANDLFELARAQAPRERDQRRARALAAYLSELHATRASSAEYVRAARDLIGSGEGIFGLIDAYPPDAVISAARLEALEARLVPWRGKLRGWGERSRRTHGDFHPFNLLFREGADLSVLDCSRGGVGDPADDVTCLSINYLFFSLHHRAGKFDGALRELWDTFWSSYLERARDPEVLEVVAPFFAWRALVVTSPVWYPDVDPAVRDRIFTFAERLLEGATFEPARVEVLLGG